MIRIMGPRKGVTTPVVVAIVDVHSTSVTPIEKLSHFHCQKMIDVGIRVKSDGNILNIRSFPTISIDFNSKPQ
jgi:hypothetical protein